MRNGRFETHANCLRVYYALGNSRPEVRALDVDRYIGTWAIMIPSTQLCQRAYQRSSSPYTGPDPPEYPLSGWASTLPR